MTKRIRLTHRSLLLDAERGEVLEVVREDPNTKPGQPRWWTERGAVYRFEAEEVRGELL